MPCETRIHFQRQALTRLLNLNRVPIRAQCCASCVVCPIQLRATRGRSYYGLPYLNALMQHMPRANPRSSRADFTSRVRNSSSAPFLAISKLPSNLRRRKSGIHLLQGRDHLRLRVPASQHPPLLNPKSYLVVCGFWGAGHYLSAVGTANVTGLVVSKYLWCVGTLDSLVV